jgi:FHA domain
VSSVPLCPVRGGAASALASDLLTYATKPAPVGGDAPIPLDTRRIGKVGLTVGRDPSCDVRLSDQLASGRHARLWRDETGKVMIEDLGSTNGTFHNGQKIQRASLRPGDTVNIGGTKYSVT